MRCKNCGHRVIFLEGKWEHWNEPIHSSFDFKVYEKDCLCKKPEPKEKTLEMFTKLKK